MARAFHPFVIEIDYGSSFVEVERDWYGDVVAHFYGTSARAEMLMSQQELDDMYETVDEAEYWREEPSWSLINRAVAEREPLVSADPIQNQIAAE